jgi:hypothetical protein
MKYPFPVMAFVNTNCNKFIILYLYHTSSTTHASGLPFATIYIVTYMPIARQRHVKHIPVKRTYAIEGRPLLRNGPVNTIP